MMVNSTLPMRNRYLSLESRISREVSSANAWYEINGMIANPSKHQGMILGKIDHQFNFSVNDSVELFGVDIDKDLTFKVHLTPKFSFRLQKSSCFGEYFFQKIVGFG